MARWSVAYALVLIACGCSSTRDDIGTAAMSGAGETGSQQRPVGVSASGAVSPRPGIGGSVSAASAGTPASKDAGSVAPAAPRGGAGGVSGIAAATGGESGSGGTRAPLAGMAASTNAGAAAGSTAMPADDNCAIGNASGTRPAALTLSGDTAAHDPTMIEAGGTYYRFWTGDRIPVATSTDLMNWRDAQPVYRNGYPMWSKDWLAGVSGQTFNFPWAPDASHFGDQYHLYSAFSAKFGDNISCITHLTTTDVAANDWMDHGPVICTKGSEKYNAIDAEVGLDLDGTAYLAFGSFWDGIFAFKLDAKGDRVGTDLTRLAWAKEIEAPVMFHRCGYYYLLVSWGLCCPGNDRSVDQLTYKVVVGRSKNIMGPYVDRKGVSMVEGGGSVIVQGDNTFAAAGHSDVLLTKGHFYHLYHAYRRPSGRAELRIVEMQFDAEGWPVAGPP
jgi:arabinan endo-1,5-alpha-L-arabinosidase